MLWTSHLVDEGISLVNEVGKPGELWYGCDMPFLENGSWKPLRSDHEVWNQMAGCPRKASKWSTRRIGCAMKCWVIWRRLATEQKVLCFYFTLVHELASENKLELIEAIVISNENGILNMN